MSKKIIVIDDIPEVLEILTDLFELENFEVLSFEFPEEALDYLVSNNDYDCVICDINMPVLNGLDLFIRYREQSKSHIPFIFNSAHVEFVEEVDKLVEKYPPATFVNKVSTHHVQIVNELLSQG